MLGFQGALAGYGDYFWYYIGGDVHNIGAGHWFNWVGDYDDCGLPASGCTDVNHVRYYSIGYHSHRASYSIVNNSLFFR